MSNKTPFELRYDLLEMAKNMLDSQYQVASDMAWEAFRKAAETNKDLYKDYEKYVPKMYTPSEVIRQAKEFQDFISNKS